MSLYKDMEMGTFVANSVSGIWQDWRREDEQLIDSLLTHFSKNNLGGAKTKARLSGLIFLFFWWMSDWLIGSKKILIYKFKLIVKRHIRCGKNEHCDKWTTVL